MNLANSSALPKPSLSVKLAGEFLRGRSRKRGDSVDDNMRFGDRGLPVPSWFSSLNSLKSLKSRVLSKELLGVMSDVGERGVFKGPKTEPFGTREGDGAEVKSNLPSEKPRLFSDCLLNCSNSGFWSTGMTRGDMAAVERTFDEGGLQLPRMCCAALEAKTSLPLDSTWRPK